MNIHVLNRKEELLTIIHNDDELGGVLSFNLVEDLAELDTLDFEVSGNVEGIEHIAEGNYILTQNLAGKWKQFVVTRAIDSHGLGVSKLVESEECISELGDDENLVEYSGKVVELGTAVAELLAGTRYTVGTIATPLIAPQLEKSTRYASKLSVLKQLAAAAGLNIFVDVAVNSNNEIVKTVHLKEKNKEEGKRFEFDSDLGSIERAVDATCIKTAIRPLGAAIEQSEEDVAAGKPVEYVTIKDVVWFKSEGKPLDKPAGQELLIDPEATEKYGVLGADGSMKPKVIVMQFDDITDPELLAVKAWAELDKLAKPQINYAFTATDLTQHMSKLGEGEKPVEVGDVCYAIDDSVTPPIVTEVVIRRIEGNPDQKDSMKVEIGIPETTLVDGITGSGSIGVSGGAGGSGSVADLTAIKASINELKANKAEITDLEATNATVENLKADVAKISKVEADLANLGEVVIGKADIANLEAVDAKITQLKTEVAYVGDLEAANAKINDLTAKKANITDLNATNATVNNLKAEVAKIGKLEVDIAAVNKLVANKADITDLNAANAKIESLQSGKADIGQLNAANANIQTLLAHKATIEELIAGNISAENIAAGTITADSAIVASLNASKITTGTLDAKKVTVTNLNAASITAGTIDASKVNVTNINASNINTGTLDASKVTVSNVNAGSIIGGTLDAAKVTVRNLSASVITTGTLNAASVNITNLNATNITTGNLDCNRVNIKNLRADSIVAGSITVQGENLQKNSDFSAGFKNWNKTSGEMFIIQDSTILTDVKICMFRRTGLTSNSSAVMYSGSKAIKAIPGETFIASAYIFVQGNYTPMDADCSVSIWFYDKEGTYLKGTGTAFNNVVKGEWTRWYHTATAPANTAYVAMGVAATRNGQFAWAKPMLSKGTIASEWKPHTDELISSGAIDNDKLAGDSVTSDKLVLDEIFASEAFVTKFEAVEIKAAQITTGKIASEFLDIEGIISFKKNQNAFGEDMADNFIFDTTADKTFINGGAIYANSVTAEKINAKGLKITNAGNATTFQVFDAQSAAASNGRYQEGDVIITGTMESTNYDPASNSGYRIDKDGNVDIYNANIRGDVILPQAGITNYGQQNGGENLLSNSDFALTTTISSAAKNPNCYPVGWSAYNGGVTNPTTSYHAHVNTTKFGFNVVEYNESDGSRNWKAISLGGLQNQINGTKEYYISMDVYSTIPNARIYGGFHYIKTGGTSASFHAGQYSISNFQVENWHRVSAKVPKGTDIDLTKNITLYIYSYNYPQNGIVYIKNVKLEEGNKATPWCPNKADAAALNPVRFWAGTDFAKRDEAPFQVLQDGTVKATRGEFGGTFTGELSIGNIRIADTNTSEATITVHTNNNAKKVLEFNEQIAFIGTNLTLGAENAPSLEFDSTSRTFNFTKSAVHIVGNKSKVSFPADNSATIMKAGYNGDAGYYECTTKYENGSYVHQHNGVVDKDVNAPDFVFERAEGDTTVKVNGAVDVTNEVVVGSVKIVNRSKNGKKRIDFVVV